MSDGACLFCRIISKEIPAKVLFEDDHVLAFFDVNPQAPTHVLVIPKEHMASLGELLDSHGELHRALLQGVRRAARETKIEEGGYRTVVNTGANAGQSVSHLHFHVLGGRPLGWPPG